MDRLLSAAVAKIATHDPEYQLEVLVIPELDWDATALREHIEGCGGEVVRVEEKAVFSRIAIAQVRCLADSDIVMEVRMVRTHHTH
jgi:hypothetical protein